MKDYVCIPFLWTYVSPKKYFFCSKNRGKVYKYLFEKSRKRDL